MKKLALALVIGCVSLGMGLGVQAQQKGEVKEDPVRFQRLMQSAQQGDLEAQYKLGVILFHGLNGLRGDKDEEEALKWFRGAAESGHSGAQYYMGEILQYGLAGVEQDAKQAMEWYQRSADQGHLLAQTMVKHLKGEEARSSTPKP